MSKAELVFITEDHPEAHGREPQHGESAYVLRFPLQDGGTELVVMVGERGFQNLTQLLFDMLSNAPSHSDGSTNA